MSDMSRKKSLSYRSQYAWRDQSSYAFAGAGDSMHQLCRDGDYANAPADVDESGGWKSEAQAENLNQDAAHFRRLLQSSGACFD